MSVSVQREGGRAAGVSLAVVRRLAGLMLAELGLERAELSVLLTGDAAIRKLNRRYRSKDRATDVLAFAMREGEPLGAAASADGAGELLGDVVISLETAARQGAEAGRPVAEEVRLLLAHGLLHLVGYDHQTDEEEREMQEATRALVRACTVKKPRNPPLNAPRSPISGILRRISRGIRAFFILREPEALVTYPSNHRATHERRASASPHETPGLVPAGPGWSRLVPAGPGWSRQAAARGRARVARARQIFGSGAPFGLKPEFKSLLSRAVRSWPRVRQPRPKRCVAVTPLPREVPWWRGSRRGPRGRPHSAGSTK